MKESRIAAKLLFGLALALSATLAWAQANGGTVTVCTEDAASGCVQDIFSGVFVDSIVAASDGEDAFFPFDTQIDSSDGIRFSEFHSNVVFIGATGWVQIDPLTWVLPGDLSGIGCGAENNNTCEPVGAWYYPGQFFIDFALGSYLILSPDGVTISDVIVLSNNGPDGNALIQFSSDPSLPAPEPASLALIGIGMAGLAFARRRKS